MGRIVFKELRWKATRSVGAAGVLVAAVLHPAAATADSTLYGLTSSSLLGNQFGTIDPIAGAFTSIGTDASALNTGYYAPVYDPTRNVFYITDSPISGSGSSGTVDEIGVSTGAITSFGVSGRGILGLGFDTTNGKLYGLTSSSLLGNQFGTIDPITGAFTSIGTDASALHTGYYAPVYDPTRNVFYITNFPISGSGSSGTVDEIDVSTGAVTSFFVPGRTVLGLGVAAGGAVSSPVPEPGSALQLLAYLLGIAVVAKRRLGRRSRNHMWTAPACKGFLRLLWRNGQVRSYVRPFGAVHVTAGPDGVR